MTGGIFINDRRVDSALGAGLLERKLIARFGAGAVFRDSRPAESATEFDPVLWSTLRRSDVLLVVIGPHWRSESRHGRRLLDHRDDFVRTEVAEALREGVDVLAVLTGDARLPIAGELPEDVRRLAGRPHHVIRPRDPEPDIDRIVEELAVRQDLSERPAGAGKERPAGADKERTRAPGEETKGGITITRITAAGTVVVGDQTNYYRDRT